MLKKETSKKSNHRKLNHRKSNHRKLNHRKSKKQIRKKNLKGGLGNNRQYWNQHPYFMKTNHRLKDSVILSAMYRPENSQYNLYKPLLDNLLKINNGIINMDFISNFARNIYYDIGRKPEFEIGLDKLNPGGKQKAIWVNPANAKYTIKNAITQGHGNTTILFLEDVKQRTQKVLKIFNRIDVDTTKIKDYLSLNVSEIKSSVGTFEFSTQKNYLLFPDDVFNVINFNMDNNFIESNNGSKLYLSVKNNDALNDYIINLILQNINESMPREEKFKFVKYDNLFVTRVNGVFRYCIIMEKLEGSLEGYIETLKMNDYTELYRIFRDVEEELNKLKIKPYLFTHTDMKVENVFYNKFSMGASATLVRPYLADFDKASITFHNIRFYNDITVTGGVKSYTDPTGFIGSYLQDSYTKRMGTHRKHLLDIASGNVRTAAAASANNSGDAAASASANNRGAAAAAVNNSIGSVDGRNITLRYGLSRVGIDMAARIGVDRIETEQTYMRYNLTPYYTSFDMAILLCSLFNKKKIDKLNKTTDLYRLISRYIATDRITAIFNKFNTAELPPGQTGNFGLLTGILIGSTLPEDYFIHTYVYEPPNPFINRLYKTTINKIALTIPFVPTSEKFYINIGNHSENTENAPSTSAIGAVASAAASVATAPVRLLKGAIDICRQGDDTAFKCNEAETRQIYRQIEDPRTGSFLDSLNSQDFIVEYNIDYCAGRGAVIPLPQFILKTNRYSFTDKTAIPRVYDYDTITEPEIIPSLRFFFTISNRQ
jgi:hypothetical protein